MSHPKNKRDPESDDTGKSGVESSRAPDNTNLDQVKPGTPWGVAAPHIYTHARHALSGAESIKAAYTPLDLPEQLRRNVIGFLGNFGSGKTEVAVNFVLQMGLASMAGESLFPGPVKIIDLDIVNPYFRSREATDPLKEAGVEVISPGGEQFWADLPIVLPQVKGLIQRRDGLLVLDIGGDDLGARVLSHIRDEFKDGEYILLMVVNANRPFTSDLKGARKVLGELEEASGLKIGGLVSNTHLMDETDPDEIRKGFKFTKEMGKLTGLPVLLVTAESRLIGDSGVSPDEFGCPLMPVYRFMLPPWASGGQVKGRTGGESRAIDMQDGD